MSRILAVDDSNSMREMVAFTLRSAGFDVAEAPDGAEALELARKEKFRLVLCDVNMPRMDGISLVKALRELPDYKFTPLLMLTTCLLYTSPSPRDKRQSRMPSSA